ncbi:hypothetical protein AB1L42_20640 [Thalassoglobus sp. JC818]|uniref:hypothetical protein n=1 Tax=Thalassoglobus sp. JC818 TaxID=3232136 RepID=UPI00345A031A
MWNSLRDHSTLLVLLIVLLQGCDSSSRSLALDEEQARAACETFLKTWQAGESVESLKPTVVGRDIAWDAGQRLVSFEFQPEEFNDGTNLHIPVTLVLEDGKGKSANSKVVYVVGTSPVITVFRE